MDLSLYILLLCTTTIVILFYLYDQGYITIKKIKSVLFIFKIKKNTDNIKFQSATGWTRHVLKIDKSGGYEFNIDLNLASGDLDIFILDREKDTIIVLNKQNKVESTYLEYKDKYYIQWNFRNATGDGTLHWNNYWSKEVEA